MDVRRVAPPSRLSPSANCPSVYACIFRGPLGALQAYQLKEMIRSHFPNFWC